MDGRKTLCENLIKWLQTLELSPHHATPEDLSDGVAVAEALSQIAPEYFTASWNSKIKSDVGSNWRLKVSNLKKILEGVVDYHQDVLNLSLQEFARPDVINIAESADPVHLGRLLQLVLSCAVNCEQKEEYITRIMELEISLQRSIMQAIQELEDMTLGASRGSAGAETAARPDEQREVLAQRCHDLEIQLKVLAEEKNTLLAETQRLSASVARRELDAATVIDDAGTSLGPAHAGTLRYTDMRTQLDRLKEQLDKVEQQRDDQAARADALQREIALESMRREELQKAAAETAALKDEVDALRETATKAAALESAVNSYKKRMEEHGDLRRQVKLLEQSNLEHVQRGIEQEQVVARAQATRAQLDIYKKQVTELNEKLDAEITKADKLEIEHKKLSTKLFSVQRERDNLLHERDALKETCEELRCSTIQTGASEENMSRELIPNEMKERLVRLEHENKLLRQSSDQASGQALLEDYMARLEKQRALNREANQRIMQLEASLEEAREGRTDGVDGATPTGDNNAKQLSVALEASRRKVALLQEALAAREAEIAATEDKYKKCVEKAKEVIKTLDPKNTGHQSLSELTLNSARGVAGTAGAAAAGPRSEGARPPPAEAAPRPGWAEGIASMRETEERLLTTAWFRLGERCHRDSVEQRFALLSAGQSFLARQRRAPPRKPRTPYKGE